MRKAEMIRHIPNKVGPDVKFGVERYPAYPIQDDFVLIFASVWPEAGGYNIFIEWTLNDRPMEPVKGAYVNDFAENLHYYRFELGSFKEGDSIKYRIKVHNMDDTVSSREFRFKVYNLYEAETLASVEPMAGGMKLQFSGWNKDKFPPLYLYFVNGSLKISITETCPLKGLSEAIFLREERTCLLQDRTTGRKVVIDNNLSKLSIKDENNVTLLESYDGLIGFLSLIGSTDGQIHSFKLNFRALNKAYFGFGEKFDRLNQKGLRPKTYVYNKPGNQNEKTYMPVPFFFSENGYGMFADTSYQVDFELATNRSDLLEINARTTPQKPCLDLYVLFGEPKAVIRSYLNMTGVPGLPPKWVFGPWISSNGWNTQKEVQSQIDKMNSLGLPASVVVIEAWSDENTYYLFNDSTYKTVEGAEAFKYDDLKYTDDGSWPDPKAMVDYIHKNNMKLVLWQIPVIKSKVQNTIVQHLNDRRHVIDNKLCVTYSDGTPYVINHDWFSHSMLPDFTNPQTRKWWAEKRRYLAEELGVDGFKTDGGEFVFDDDVVFYNGEDGAQMHNKYPQHYISTYYEFMREDMVTFSRAGSSGSQKYPIYWSGDQCSTFKELRSVIRANLSLNISGNPFCGFDLGGFIHEIPTPELFIRGAQFAAFSPIMQFHSEGGTEQNNDRSPWNMVDRTGDQRVLDIYRNLSALRMNLIPYIYNEAGYIAKNCEPLMRPLFIDYHGNSNVLDIEFEYMFGRSLLVAPLTEEGIWQRDIFLPEGEWTDFFNGTVYEGNKFIRYSCGLSSIPVFIKNDSIIPLNLNDEFEIGGCIGNSLSTYKNLCFILTGELKGEFEFCDDIGNSVMFSSSNKRLKIKISGPVDKIYLLSNKELEGYTKQEEKTINGTVYSIYKLVK